MGKKPNDTTTNEEQVVKQAKYVLSALSLEEKVEWENLVREQIWNASTTDEVYIFDTHIYL